MSTNPKIQALLDADRERDAADRARRDAERARNAAYRAWDAAYRARDDAYYALTPEERAEYERLSKETR
jgi:hypothetical protein